MEEHYKSTEMRVFKKNEYVGIDNGILTFVASQDIRMAESGTTVILSDELGKVSYSALFTEIENEAGALIGTKDQTIEYLAGFISK